MENAIYWYEKGAALYDINACNHLAILYATGNGVKKNETKAFELLFTSADQGYPDAGYNIAMACHFGQGTIETIVKLSNGLKKSASANHKLAALALADIHEYGFARQTRQLHKSPILAGKSECHPDNTRPGQPPVHESHSHDD